MPAPKKLLASITVPCRGNNATRKALKQLADSKNVFMADLVFDALTQVYGDELKSLIAFFAAKSGSSENHTTPSKTNASEDSAQ